MISKGIALLPFGIVFLPHRIALLRYGRRLLRHGRKAIPKTRNSQKPFRTGILEEEFYRLEQYF